MFIDVYAIQNVPPCNINRDDTGTPKTAIYGGALRARVSSQAWKRAMRESFPSMLGADELGVRTKKAVSLVADKITEVSPEMSERAMDYAEAVLKAAGVKVKESKRAGSDSGSPVTEYLLFISRSEIAKLADIAVNHFGAGEDPSSISKELKKEVSAAFHGTQALDIALFGRMLADSPDLNVDAAAQVAHAISVDKITQEYDFFTAIDDCVSEDNAGAAMIETNGFNSSTLYRYATVNVDSLLCQLGDVKAAACGARAFIEAFATSMPTGKQNSFANKTLPNALLVSIRNGGPINAVSAFEVPVRATADSSISHQAEEKLADSIRSFETSFGQSPKRAMRLATDGGGEQLRSYGEETDFVGMLAAVEDEVMAYGEGD